MLLLLLLFSETLKNIIFKGEIFRSMWEKNSKMIDPKYGKKNQKAMDHSREQEIIMMEDMGMDVSVFLENELQGELLDDEIVFFYSLFHQLLLILIIINNNY